MKTLRMIGMALFAVLMCVNFASCSSDENDVPQKAEEILVSFGLCGEINVSESPLSRTEEKPDLYGIQIYSCPNSLESTTSEYTPFAYGIFDDVSSITASLLKGYKYKVSILLIKNGKNILRVNDYGEYVSPFNAALSNSFTLSTEEAIKPGHTISYSDGTQYFNDAVEKYYGETTDFIPSDENNSIDIFMKKMFFGGKFIAENLTEGTLSIIFEEFIAPQIDIISPETTIQKLFALRDVRSAYNSEDYTNDIKITLIWTKADGAEVPLGIYTIQFKRNKLHTIRIKIKEVNSTSGIGIELEEGEFEAGDEMIIEDGEIVDTSVGTETEG